MGCLLACLLCLQVTADHLKNQQTKNSLGKEKYTIEKSLSFKNVHFRKKRGIFTFFKIAHFSKFISRVSVFQNFPEIFHRVESPRKTRPIIQIRRDIKHNNLM